MTTTATDPKESEDHFGVVAKNQRIHEGRDPCYDTKTGVFGGEDADGATQVGLQFNKRLCWEKDEHYFDFALLFAYAREAKTRNWLLGPPIRRIAGNPFRQVPEQFNTVTSAGEKGAI